MKIFVTGATGFIGSHFLNAALAAGHTIVALRRSISALPRVPLIVEPIWLEKDMHEVTSEDFIGCDALVHLAAGGVTPQPATWDVCYRVNVIDSLKLCEVALGVGIRRIVAAGTYAEYGLAGLRYDPIPPDAPLEPIDSYAASKASASVALCAMCRVLGFELVYLRLFSVFGEGQYEKNFWPQLRAKALAGEDFLMTAGNQVRDFIGVELVAQKFLEACTSPLVKAGRPVVANLASGRPVSLLEFANFWWIKFKAGGKIRPGEIPERLDEVQRYVPLVEWKMD